MFIQTGILLSPSYLSLITPARWFTADAQDNSFPKLRQFVRNHNHFSVINSYIGKNLFPSTDLSTVSAFLWDKKYSGDVRFTEYFGEYNEMTRPLFEKDCSIILPSNNLVSILKKVAKTNFIPLNTITTGRDAFGIVGKNIERLRKEKGIKQKDFISKMQIMGCDINPTSYSKLEGQIRIATDKEIYVIAKILNVTTDTLFNEE